ncbi:hypothetical protein ANAEL_05642 [Anaerolineales bacterium]|nr:hypothetical protein ANAEL_05642 [Anaerolineales bacterium]
MDNSPNPDLVYDLFCKDDRYALAIEASTFLRSKMDDYHSISYCKRR